MIFYDKMKILAIHLRGFMDYAQLRGIPRNALMRSMKNPPPDLGNPDAKADITDYFALLAYISNTLSDDLLGVRVGSQLNLNTLGVIFKISLKATTNEEAIYYCHSYLRKTIPLLQITGSVSGKMAVTTLQIETGDSGVDRIIVETLLTIMAREIRIISGEETRIRLTSPHHHAGYPAEWTKGRSFTISFNQTVLKAALQEHHSWGLDVLIPEYLRLVSSMKPERSFGARVKIAALNLATPALPDLKTVAAAFNMTERTLQRRLTSEGRTYRQMMDELKREISGLLLRHDRFSVADISSVLGYSEPAAFIHSFRKWHGESPMRMRGIPVQQRRNTAHAKKEIPFTQSR